MKIIRIFITVRKFLFVHKVRVFLSLIGISIGIAAVILMYSIGEGARKNLLSSIEKMGSNLITIDAGKIENVIGRKRETMKSTTLKLKDFEELMNECSYVVTGVPTQDATLETKYDGKLTRTRVIGTLENFLDVRNYQLSDGRFFSEEENYISKRYAVIGQKCLKVLFDYENPIGEYIKINNIKFEIIGVLKEKGMSYDGADEDEVILIPIKTAMRRLMNVDYIKNIYIQIDSKENMTLAEDEIRSILRDRHKLNMLNKKDDFTLQNIYTSLKAETQTNTSFTFLVTGVSSLAQLVGGVGILAIMILSVRERKSEIGLRMAVGAKPKNIFLQFLSEAVFLSCLGGVLGIIIGVGLSFSIGFVTSWQIEIYWEVIIISFFLSSVLGIVFGVYPAVKASRLEPIVALNC